MIGAGGLAEIDRNEPARVRTPQPEARSGQGRAQAAPLNYAALSNGLVRGREAEQAALVDDATQEGEALMLAFAEETASSAAPDEFPVPGGQDDGEDEPKWAGRRGGIDEELRGQGRGRGRGGLGGADDDNDQGEDEG